MIATLLLLNFAASGQAEPPARLEADLDGQGAVESASAAARGKKVHLEIRDSRGKLLDESIVPSPGGSLPRLALTAGSLGSAGALVEVEAATAEADCRSVWRYREGRLSQVPLQESAAAVPPCGPPEWSTRWERPSEDAPAIYVRERSRERPNGLLRQVEAFRYAGFRLERDAARSSAWINGVEIPAWRNAVLYRRAAVEQLASRFDLSPFQSQSRLSIRTDQTEGIFEVRIEEPASQAALPVTAASPGQSKGEVILTAGTQGARVRVLLTGERSVALEADVTGLGERLDGAYVAVTRRPESGLRVYDSAEQELTQEFLSGTWDDGKEQLSVTQVPASPTLLRYGKSEVSLSVTRAPRGADVLLLPKDGSLPVLGLLLRGPDSFVEVPVRCQAGVPRCEAGAPARALHRVGALLNVH